MHEKSLFRTLIITMIGFWLGVFVVLPNLMVVIVSFLERDETNLIRAHVSLHNYLALLDPVFFQIFQRSMMYAVGSTLACLLIAYPFAYFITRVAPKARSMLLILVIVPFWTSSLIRTYSLIILLKANGLINTALIKLHLIDAPLTILYTHTAVMIGLVYTLLPFMILPLYAAIEKLDHRLVEAARDLGASSMQVFLKVFVPLTMPGIVAGCTLVFLSALGLFYIPDLLGGAKTMLVGNFIKNQFLTARDWPFGAAASTMLTLTMGLFLTLYYRSLRKLSGSHMGSTP